MTVLPCSRFKLLVCGLIRTPTASRFFAWLYPYLLIAYLQCPFHSQSSNFLVLRRSHHHPQTHPLPKTSTMLADCAGTSNTLMQTLVYMPAALPTPNNAHFSLTRFIAVDNDSPNADDVANTHIYFHRVLAAALAQAPQAANVQQIRQVVDGQLQPVQQQLNSLLGMFVDLTEASYQVCIRICC